MGGRGFLVPDGERGRGVVEVEERLRDRFEVPGQPVGGTVVCGGGEHGGVVGEESEKRERLGAGGFGSAGFGGAGFGGAGFGGLLAGRAREAEERRAAGERVGTGVCVADKEQRVVLALDEEAVPEGARSWPAGRSSPQRVASGPNRPSSSPAVAPAGTGRIPAASAISLADGAPAS